MKSNDNNYACMYCDCEEVATVFDENLQAHLCEKHLDMWENSTGYCSQSCCLGHGCDQSC